MSENVDEMMPLVVGLRLLVLETSSCPFSSKPFPLPLQAVRVTVNDAIVMTNDDLGICFMMRYLIFEKTTEDN